MEVDKATPKKSKKVATPTRIRKEIGGERNGGFRNVIAKKSPRYYQTQERRAKAKRRFFRPHTTPKLRSSITPGAVLILVAGRHRGKRVVFLKQLKSGLLLVTGPYGFNKCPLRRINQMYVIGTKTKIDISGIALPERLTDKYFRRQILKKTKKTDAEIFGTKKQKYKVSKERKEDQKIVDKQVVEAMRKHPDKRMLALYLKTLFKLEKNMFPHQMVF